MCKSYESVVLFLTKTKEWPIVILHCQLFSNFHTFRLESAAISWPGVDPATLSLSFMSGEPKKWMKKPRTYIISRDPIPNGSRFQLRPFREMEQNMAIIS